MPDLITTLGPKRADELGMILPHEHVFVDLRTWEKPGYGEADVGDVVKLMAPEIEAIKARGFTALVECSTVGVGRRADFDRAVSLVTGFPIVVPTGIYREPWVPPFAYRQSEEALADWMTAELEDGIESSGVRAGWIKLSAGDDGIAEVEAKILRAASKAGKKTGAVIGSHTIRGRVVMEQLDIIERAGYSAGRFISIHTQAEPDFAMHLAVARRGAWIEYDGIGRWAREDAEYVGNIHRVLDAGFGSQLLLSHDRGWYDPAQPRGGTPKPYTYLSDVFLPKLAASGVDAATIAMLTRDNPFRAFAR
jgi:phosphotriesterase-related protein